MARRRRIGRILVDSGLITDDQLQAALADQGRSSMKLGQVLVRRGFVDEEALVNFLSDQLRISRYFPERYPIDMSLAALVPHRVALQHSLCPIERQGVLLRVAMLDPMDINAIDTVEAMTNLEAEPVICTEMEMTQITSGIYGAPAGFDGILEDIGDLDIAPDEEPVEEFPELKVSSLVDMAEDAPVVRMVNWIIAEGVRQRASDIHISPEKSYVQLRFRIDGRLREIPAPPKSMVLPIISRVKILSGMDIAISRVPQDGRLTINVDGRDVNIRASVVPTTHGENVVLRLLDMAAGIHTLDALGMSPADLRKVESIIPRPYGMILSTGPTGSGKTTALYAILQKLNRPDINIITLEDPVEYRVEKIRQLQLNRKAGMTFASGLRAVLRQDPDVIMIGEVRDGETASIAAQAALTGHRVLSTVHTNDAAGAITRLADMGVPAYLVASVMLASIGQRLVRKICPHCKTAFKPPDAVLKNWGLELDGTTTLMRGKGCAQCMNTGYAGRTGVYEVLLIDETIQDMIVHGRTAREITQQARTTQQFVTMREDALQKALQGITTLEEAASAVML